MVPALDDGGGGPSRECAGLVARGVWLYKRFPAVFELVAHRYPQIAPQIRAKQMLLELAGYEAIGAIGNGFLEFDAEHPIEEADIGDLCRFLDPSGALEAVWRADPDEAVGDSVRNLILAFFARFCQ